jgi:hypothetical protein
LTEQRYSDTDLEGQVGADVSAALIDLKIKAAALCFGSQQDALDYATHVGEDRTRRPLAGSLDSLDCYLKGQITAYICVRSRFSDHQCHLAFRSVPADVGIVGAFLPVFARDVPLERGNSIADFEGNEATVFFGVTELVQKPEGTPIPSFVWLETAKHRHDFRRNISADLPTRDIVFELGESVPEGKIGLFGVDLSSGESGGVSRLIQNSSEIVNYVKKDAGQHFGQWLGEFDFVNNLSGFRLSIHDVGPWLSVSERMDQRFEIMDVVLCANEGQPRAVENICHDRQIRSNTSARISKSDSSFRDDAAKASFGNEDRQAQDERKPEGESDEKERAEQQIKGWKVGSL